MSHINKMVVSNKKLLDFVLNKTNHGNTDKWSWKKKYRKLHKQYVN